MRRPVRDAYRGRRLVLRDLTRCASNNEGWDMMCLNLLAPFFFLFPCSLKDCLAQWAMGKNKGSSVCVVDFFLSIEPPVAIFFFGLRESRWLIKGARGMTTRHDESVFVQQTLTHYVLVPF